MIVIIDIAPLEVFLQFLRGQIKVARHRSVRAFAFVLTDVIRKAARASEASLCQSCPQIEVHLPAAWPSNCIIGTGSETMWVQYEELNNMCRLPVSRCTLVCESGEREKKTIEAE